MCPASPGESADLAVVNTCAVTVGAMRDNRLAIRKVADKGRTPVIVIGCGATADANRLGSIPGVTAVVGHSNETQDQLRSHVIQSLIRSAPPQIHASHDFHERAMHLSQSTTQDTRRMSDAGRPSGGATASEAALPARPIIPLPLAGVKKMQPVGGDEEGNALLLDRIDTFAGHSRAFLKVQDGCDAFCTYCIIPQLRPDLRYKPIDVAVAEATALVHKGYKEIILTGIFLGAFGRSTAVRKRFTSERPPLVRLIDAIAKVDGLERLRLSSLEPGDVTGALLEVFRSNKACVPHFHLPLQSGSQDVLRRMNRQYSTADFAAMVDRVRSALDRPAISTDIVVGFPGESDVDFAATMELARYSRFCKIHAFPFSPRSGTAAARWNSQFVPHAKVRERMNMLAELDAQGSLDYRRSTVGIRERVIIEGIDEESGYRWDHPKELRGVSSIHYGRSDRYFEVRFESNARFAKGDVVPVRIFHADRNQTLAVCLASGVEGNGLPVLSSAPRGL